MQTTRLVSTISWNTPDFLRGKLQDLVRSGVLEYGYWVYHEPEEDETKAHAHVLVKPNRRLDTSALRNLFVETIPGEEKPRGVAPFRHSSRISDWLLYSAHDVAYLMRKGESRKIHYERSDFHSTDEDLFDEDWRDCHRASDDKIPLLLEMAKSGKTWLDVVKMGFLPVNQLFQYKDIFFTFAQGEVTNRNGRDGHE